MRSFSSSSWVEGEADGICHRFFLSFSLSLYTFFSGTRAMCKDKFNIFPCATYCVTRGLFASFSPSKKKKEDVGGGDRNVDGRLRRHRLDYLSTSTPAKASVSFLYLVHLSSSSSFPKQNSSRVSCASLPPLVLISPPASKVDPDRKKP